MAESNRSDTAIDKEISFLKTRYAEIRTQILEIQKQGDPLKEYKENLHKYNEIKVLGGKIGQNDRQDTADYLIGQLAEMKSLTIAQVHSEMGIECDEAE